MARIVFFASIREDLECESISFPVDEPCRVSELIAGLARDHGDHWQLALTAENVRVAVNQELVSGDPVISDADEVAFFPPVTGG